MYPNEQQNLYQQGIFSNQPQILYPNRQQTVFSNQPQTLYPGQQLIGYQNQQPILYPNFRQPNNQQNSNLNTRNVLKNPQYLNQNNYPTQQYPRLQNNQYPQLSSILDRKRAAFI